MPKLKDVIEDLIATFGLRRCISYEDYASMHADFDRKDYARCVAKVRNMFKLSMVRIKINYVSSDEMIRGLSAGEREALWKRSIDTGVTFEIPMRIGLPEKVPLYGTTEFFRLTANLKINTDSLDCPFDNFLAGLAHEMSHLILYALHHPWHKSEKATDLTILIHGFMEVYERIYATGDIYYLTREEVEGVCRFLRERKCKK